MASAYGFNIFPDSQGVIFALSGIARQNRRQSFGQWEAELCEANARVCVRSPVLNLNEPLANVIEAAHDIAQKFLDIMAVEERNALIIIEPLNHLVWRSGPYGLKLQLTSDITFSAEFNMKAVIRNAAGEVLPDPPYMPPQHHYAYRYFRYSQAAQNVHDAYRNMFLALESLLDYVEQKKWNDTETDWLERALTTAQMRGLSLSAFAKPGSTNAVGDFLDAHYSAVRCAVFHSKSSSGHAIRPGSLNDDGVVLQQLLAVQALVESLLRSEFSVRLPGSGFTNSGFGKRLSWLEPVIGLCVSVGDCPTIEQIMAEEDNLPDGDIVPVKFAGPNGSASDEWLFISEIKPPALSFSTIASLRLITKPNNDILLGPIANKINHTLMTTQLDLTGVPKLVLRVRCILSNLQSPKHKFSH